MLRLSMVRMGIRHEHRLVGAVPGESDRRDAEAGEGAFEPVKPCEGAR